MRARVRGPGAGEGDGDGDELGSESSAAVLERTAWAWRAGSRWMTTSSVWRGRFDGRSGDETGVT